MAAIYDKQITLLLCVREVSTQPWINFEKEFKDKGVPMADGDERITEVRRATDEDEIRAAAWARHTGGLALVVEEPDDMEDDEVPEESAVGVEEDPDAVGPSNHAPPPVATGMPDESGDPPSDR